MWVRTVCLVAFMGIAGVVATQAADTPAELPLPTQLRELDRDYSNGLESLLAKATVQDDKPLIADIQAVSTRRSSTAPRLRNKWSRPWWLRQR